MTAVSKGKGQFNPCTFLGVNPKSGLSRLNTCTLTRKTVETIEYADVVVWADFSHIAVIDRPSAAGAGRFNMCQSAGGGPRMNDYKIVVSSPGKFRLSGGMPAKDVSGEVYVISPWPAS